MKEYSNSKSKRYIQGIIFSKLISIKSNALVLGGPNIKDYIPLVEKTISSSDNAIIKSYESDNLIFLNQFIQLNSISKKLRKKLIISFADIKYAHAERYIDLDLMTNLSYCSSTITELLKKQMALQTTKRRAFCFTYCLRSSKKYEHFTEELSSFLQKVLKVKVFISKDFEKLTYGNQYECKCSKFDISVYTYRDGTPMLTCLIKY